jgi:hypothetical protein
LGKLVTAVVAAPVAAAAAKLNIGTAKAAGANTKAAAVKLITTLVSNLRAKNVRAVDANIGALGNMLLSDDFTLVWALHNMYFPQQFGGGKSIFILIYSNLPGRNADYISTKLMNSLDRELVKGNGFHKGFTGSTIADGGIRWRINQRLKAVKEDVLKGRDPEKNARMISGYYGKMACTSPPSNNGRGSIGALEKDFKVDKLLVQTRGGMCLPTAEINSLFLNKVGYKRLKEIATISVSGSKAGARDSVTWMFEGKPQKIYYDDLKYFEHFGGGSALLRSLMLALDLHAVENYGKRSQLLGSQIDWIFPNRLKKSTGADQRQDVREQLLQFKDNPNIVLTAGGATAGKISRSVPVQTLDELRAKMALDFNRLNKISQRATLQDNHAYSVVSVKDDVVTFINPNVPQRLEFFTMDEFVRNFDSVRVYYLT